MTRRAMAVAVLALAMVPLTGAAAAAAETNVLERVECMFRVYVTEGGEQGLDCLI